MQRIGTSTIQLDTTPAVLGFGSAAGKKEGEGPLAGSFDRVFEDVMLGEKTFEKAESALLNTALTFAMQDAGVAASKLDVLLGGDLLNQCIGSTFVARDLDVPYLGLYGACSTMAESLLLASLLVESGAATLAGAMTSSHFCSSERQYRFPLEYGSQRPPTAQWTVTGAGGAIVGALGTPTPQLRSGNSPITVQHVTIGRIKDLGIADANNMGAAMAPAAADTIERFLRDTATQPRDYDLILTGDLGKVGSALLIDLLHRDQIDITAVHSDCGILIFDGEKQDTHAGGSGCGCSASVLCSYIFKRMRQGLLKNILFCATGALMSPTSFQQGESIPGIAHLLHLTAG
ncbi:MAG: stage V sporulation protein AD [Clostridia bacterium]|nr:stage V sporulation protein AD [Clostridia bacterium]